jgi:O-antigen/teichoic acid export membrane protein
MTFYHLPTFMRSLANRVRRSALVANSTWMFAGFGARLFVQAAYFVLIARSLGSYQYGTFVGATAVVSVVAPFASIGFGNLLVRNVSRNNMLFSECWGNALLVSVVSGTLLLAGVTVIAGLWMRGTFSISLILLVGVADLFAYRTVEVAAQAFQAIGQMRYTAQLNLLPNLLRLCAAAYLTQTFHHLSATKWAAFYAGTSVISLIIAMGLVRYRLGKARLCLSRIRTELWDGFYFSLGLSSQTIYNDIDKVMLARMANPVATGIYAAAYRLIEVSFTPVRAVLNAAYPEFFRAGCRGLPGSLALTKRLLPKGIVYSSVVATCLFLAAPGVTMILGNEYAFYRFSSQSIILSPML